MKFESVLEGLIENERVETQEREIINYRNFLKNLEELGSKGNVKGLDLQTKRHLSSFYQEREIECREDSDR